MPNLVMATIMAVSGRSVDSALSTHRWTYCPRLRVESSQFGFLILPIQISLDKKQLGDVHANGRLFLGMTVMLAWSNRCVPLNKLNC